MSPVLAYSQTTNNSHTPAIYKISGLTCGVGTRMWKFRYPGLGGLHSLGRRLAVAVKRATATIIEPTTWYRALPYGNGKVLPEYSNPADPRVITKNAGRFNYAGQFGYYVANCREAAATEALKARTP